MMKADRPSNPNEGKSYVFAVVVEPDEDRWHAYAPSLVRYGGATWGYTRDEALKHIQEVVEMVVEELIEDHIPVPEEPIEQARVFRGAKVCREPIGWHHA
jgi:predicted RNase H-like HicB family nuclease